MRVIKPKVYSVGVIDWNRRLFDELIPLPDGTSYNSYIVEGSEKTAILDSADPETSSRFIDNVLKAGVEAIDYIVAHHCEQDHSGCIPDLLLLYPDAKVVTNPKCKEFLIDHLGLEDESFLTIQDGEEISLGDKTLKFVYTPWVHWPETMCTYLVEDEILFSCDFLGSHLATSELYSKCDDLQYTSSKRYFAEIMMPFRPAVKKNLDKISELKISIVAPSHGPIYDKPEFIINAYKEWVSEDVKNLVVIPYVSMHHSTKEMVVFLADELMDRGVNVVPFNISGGDIGELAIELVDAATVVLASPQVLATAHPLIGYVALLANMLRPKTKFASIIGSFGWGGKMVDNLVGLLPNLKAEIIAPVTYKGKPNEEAFAQLEKLADAILEKHKEIGIA